MNKHKIKKGTQHNNKMKNQLIWFKKKVYA